MTKDHQVRISKTCLDDYCARGVAVENIQCLRDPRWNSGAMSSNPAHQVFKYSFGGKETVTGARASFLHPIAIVTPAARPRAQVKHQFGRTRF